MKVALITEILPWPLDNAPKIRLYEELKILSKNNEVDLFCFLPLDAKPDWISKVESLGVNVFAVRMKGDKVKRVWRMAESFFSKYPHYFSKWDDSRLNDVLLKRMKIKSYDLFHVDHTQMSGYLPKEYRSRAILVVHNIEHILFARYANVAPMAYRPLLLREANKIRKCELSIWRDFLKLVCMTEHDRSLILNMTGKNEGDVISIPTCVNTDYFKPAGLQKRKYPALVFTGDFKWAPTRDGLRWFLKEIFPLVIAKVRDVKVHIIGPFEKRDCRKFASKSAIFSGLVSDVRPYLEQSWLFVNPLRVAAGIRTRLLHALSMGLCAVSTTTGFEGLDDALKEFVWCEENADAFAERCIELLNNPSLLIEKGANARKIVAEHYGLDSFKNLWLNFYSAIESILL